MKFLHNLDIIFKMIFLHILDNMSVPKVWDREGGSVLETSQVILWFIWATSCANLFVIYFGIFLLDNTITDGGCTTHRTQNTRLFYEHICQRFDPKTLNQLSAEHVHFRVFTFHFTHWIEAKNNIWTNCETSFLLYPIHPILILSGKNTSNRGSVCWKHTPSSTELSEQAVKHSQHSPCSYLLHKRSPDWNYCSMLKLPFCQFKLLFALI